MNRDEMREFKIVNLAVLEELWKGCQSCALRRSRRNEVVFYRGDPNAGLFVIGDAPRLAEDAAGRPFAGEVGEFLNECFDEAGLSWISDVFMADLVGCLPPGGEVPGRAEVNMCRHRLADMLYIVQPTALLLLGGTVALRLAGEQRLSSCLGKTTEVEIEKMTELYRSR